MYAHLQIKAQILSIYNHLASCFVWGHNLDSYPKMRTMSVTDHKLLHNATLMKINVSYALQFIAQWWCCVTYMILVTRFQNYGCNLGQTNNGKRCNTTYLSLRTRSTKSRCTIWRICSDNDNIMYEVRTLRTNDGMSVNTGYDWERRGRVRKEWDERRG